MFTCADGGRRARAGAGRIPPGGCRKRNTEGGGGTGSQPLGSAPCTVEDRSRQRREPRDPAAVPPPQPRRLHRRLRALGSRPAPERSARALPLPQTLPRPGKSDALRATEPQRGLPRAEPPLLCPTPRCGAPRSRETHPGLWGLLPTPPQLLPGWGSAVTMERWGPRRRMHLNSYLRMQNPQPTLPRDEPGLQDRYHHAANFNATASSSTRSAPCPPYRESCSTLLHATSGSQHWTSSVPALPQVSAPFSQNQSFPEHVPQHPKHSRADPMCHWCMQTGWRALERSEGMSWASSAALRPTAGCPRMAEPPSPACKHSW